MKRLTIIVATIAMAAIMCLGVSAEIFKKTRDMDKNFADVPSNSWFYSDVKSVYEMGLMEGISDTSFDADGTVSVAQAITIAARIHSTYYDKSIRDSGGSWYTKYVDYAVTNDIVRHGTFDSFTRPILSHEMVDVFAHCLPKSYFAQINNIQEIPDVSKYEGYFEEVLLFYNAGILKGDEKGNFLPKETITRKRAAAIISRTVLPKQRTTMAQPPIPKLDISRHINKTVASVKYWESEDRAYLLTVTPTATANIYTVDMICCDVKDVARQAHVTSQINLADASCGILQFTFDNDKYNNHGTIRLDFSQDKIYFKVFEVKHNLGGKGMWGFFNSEGYLTPAGEVISDYEKVLNPAPKKDYVSTIVPITLAPNAVVGA